jgi:hypothetical protein
MNGKLTAGWFLACFLLVGSQVGYTQDDGYQFTPIEESALLETKWKYTFALHLESNTIIHKAEDFYEYYLHFKYNHQYQEFLNGKVKGGIWALEGKTLQYSFKNIESFEVSVLGSEELVLQFRKPNAKGTYQYHFKRVETHQAPFVRAWNELPEVQVEAEGFSKESVFKKWWTFKKRKKKNRKKKEESIADLKPYINIELIGGGYFGGIDPVLKDFIHVKSDGRLIKEFKSMHQGLLVTKKDLPREEVLKFVEWCQSKGYFELERMYDCETAACQKRKRIEPKPVPLRLAITYGNRRKVITISIWGLDESKIRYVAYPPLLDEIIDEIQKMAHRPAENIVGK